MKPSCFKKKLDNEACYHTCPVRDECYAVTKDEERRMTNPSERLVVFNDAVTVTLPAVSKQQSFTIKNKGCQNIELSNTLFYEIKRDNSGIHVVPKEGARLLIAVIKNWLFGLERT